MVVGAIATRRKKHREQVGTQPELSDHVACPRIAIEYLQMRPRAHHMAAHPGPVGGYAFLYRIITRGRSSRNIEIHRGLDPVDAVPPATGELAAIGRTTHLVRTEDLARELEIAAVQTVMYAKNEVWTIGLEHFRVVRLAEPDFSAVQETEQFDDRKITRMQKRHTFLDPVVEVYAGPVNHRRFFQHLLDTHIDRVPVEHETPFGKRLGAGIVAAAGAGSKDQDSNFCHDQLAPK